MSIVSVKHAYAGITGQFSLEGVREYTKEFTVRTDSDSTGAREVANASGLPRKGDVYFFGGETDIGALCWNVDPQQDSENQRVWRVTCRFSNDIKGSMGTPLGGDPRYDVENPLDAPPEVVWSSWSETEIVTRDRQGIPILNTAGQPFSPPLIRMRKRRMVTITRNEAFFPVGIDQEYTDTINADVFYGWPPKTARIDDITASAHFAQAMLYWKVRYVIQFKKEHWLARVLNVGIRHHPIDEFFHVDDEVLMIAEDDGVQSTIPVQLDLRGERATPREIEDLRNTPIDNNPGWNGLFWNFEIHKQKSFANLNL